MSWSDDRWGPTGQPLDNGLRWLQSWWREAVLGLEAGPRRPSDHLRLVASMLPLDAVPVANFRSSKWRRLRHSSRRGSGTVEPDRLRRNLLASQPACVDLFGPFVSVDSALAVINLPVLLSQVLPSDGWGATLSKWINDNLANTVNPIYLIFLGLLIVGFTYFYTAIAFDPVQQADNLRKQGGFIPGIRPGPQTESYLSKVLNRITLPGAIFIVILAIVPTILVRFLLGSGASGAAYSIGGTSLLIAVGVALETMKQVDSQLMMRNYEGFLSSK